jgi:hypothetical protein
MEEQPQQKTHSVWTRPYVWIAGAIAVVAMVSGFANASPSPSQPASQPVAVVTEYRTAEPYVGGLEAAELAAERHRLNRIKGYLNARKRKLNRMRDRLAARRAALNGPFPETGRRPASGRENGRARKNGRAPEQTATERATADTE